MAKKIANTANTSFNFPPVVTVLGHVDHGKTTLLDSIRKTNIAAKEHGGITQSIGASYVEVIHEGKKRGITFIDTPGHEAFSKMRSRGAQVSDISLLIVSSVDGVMPQTKESIALLKSANTPFIVVFTKSDVLEKNIEKVKQQVLREGILLEGLGGDVPFIEVSAKTGSNIKELLELILLVYDMQGTQKEKKNKDGIFEGIIIESKLDQKTGPLATVVIKNGKISVREELICEGIIARVRALRDPLKGQKNEATIGEAVEILGFEKVPQVGGIVAKKNEAIPKEEVPVEVNPKFPSFEKSTLSLILCADTFGSLEAIVNSLPKEITILSQKTGEITPSDILLAKSAKALVIGFRAKISNDVISMAKIEKILLKNYAIIYELLDEIHDVLEGKRLAEEEQILGEAKIMARFPYEKTEVLGITILQGRVAKGDKARVMRGEEVIGESNVTSVRHGKEQVSKIEKGQEAGIILSPFLDFTIGDMVIFHR